MAKNSEIAWCDHTLNLWWGCTEVHAGCDNCYAKKLAHRWGQEVWGNDTPRLEVKSWISDLMRFQKNAFESNQVHRVFIGSMMDIFEKSKPLMTRDNIQLPYSTGDLRDKLLNEMIPQCPNLQFLLLTKRPSNINKYIPEGQKTNPPKNVIFGTSPVDQETADKLIPQLLEVNGQRFLSVEPQLEEINLKPFLKDIDWVIVGGESGPGRRTFNPEWARTIREQCQDAGVAFFMKQWDKVKTIPEDLMIRQFSDIKNDVLINPTIKIMKTEKENNINNMAIVARLSPFKKLIGEALLSGEKAEMLIERLSLERSIPKASAQAYVTMVQKLFEEKKDLPVKKQKVRAVEKEIQKTGIFTTNEDGLFVVYPSENFDIEEDENEIHVQTEIFLGPNESATSNDLNMLFVIPIDRSWYQIATKIMRLYKEKLEKELSEIGMVHINTNPQ